MITRITYHDGMYRIDGFPDVAPTYHQADLIIQATDEARSSAIMGGCDLLIDAQAFAQAGHVDVCFDQYGINPDAYPLDQDEAIECPESRPELPLLAQCAAAGREQVCQEPDNMRSVDDPCPAHAIQAAVYRAAQCATCGGEGYCPDCGTLFVCDDPRPLLAQCAAAFDALLGNAPAGGGILDELRRVRAALAEEGW